MRGRAGMPRPTLMPIHSQPQELRDYVLQGSVRGCSALEASVGLSNSVSRWVQVMVLSRPGPTQRAQVLDKFIHVAQVRPAPLLCSLCGCSHPFRSSCPWGNDITVPWPRPVTWRPILTTPALSSLSPRQVSVLTRTVTALVPWP